MHENKNEHNTGTKTIKMIRKSWTSCYRFGGFVQKCRNLSLNFFRLPVKL